ncbi:MAG: right-handed parallel beta-helix repeat-containing protein, partial [Planctomycetota bacterium]
RLYAEEGPAKTTIDAAQGGRVIIFSSSSVTRKTIVEGFTITNGLMKTSRNYGVGIHISRASPTIRHNRITNNIGDGTSWNYGGGIYITGSGANPLIAHNEIANNELRNGSWNYGAGIYVGTGAMADILGNHIHGNKNRTVGSASGGRGHGAGIYTSASVLVASNLIASNVNQTSSWNYGGGMAVTSSSSSAPARVFNNTFVGNSCTGGSWVYGGGLYCRDSATITIIGNIVVQNSVSGSNWRSGGGLYRTSTAGSGSATLDYNDVWSNTGGDYASFTKGANSISVDPKFVSATDRHLTSASPCVDAIPAAHLTSAIAMDMDMDPRRIDGDLDGGTTNGARLDIGADELTGVRLVMTGTPKLGNTVILKVTASTFSAYLLAADFQTGNLFLPPWGNLLIGPTVIVLTSGVTTGSISAGVPNTSTLVGLDVHLQAVVRPFPLSGPKGQLTNRLTVTAY